jgi:type I restriction enzyme, S subunit
MTVAWPTRPLCELAQVRVSNVDKKTHLSEQAVKLCNYMDVYSNEYVTGGIDFMEASASASEIERFALNSGDVVITKDSETPDDIGIATVVMEQIDRLVCGYHLALIRPKENELDSIYLAKQLSSSLVARYFAAHASGSTRYGLPISVIEAVAIPTPPKPEQAKIADILSTVDRAIEQTEALIAKQKRIKTGMTQDLLTRGIDEQGNLRSEEKHEFKKSPQGRIPVEWDPSTLERVGTWMSGGTPSKSNPSYWGDDMPWVCPKDMKNFDLSTTIDRLTPAGVRHGSKLMPRNTVFIVVRGMILAHTFPASIADVPMSFNQDVKAIIVNPDVEARFLAYWLVSNGSNLLKITTTATHGTKRFDMNELFQVPIGLPKKDEQCRIVSRLDAAEAQIVINKKTAAKLHSLKSGLMQDLLTGRKRVTALLEPEPKREKVYATG